MMQNQSEWYYAFGLCGGIVPVFQDSDWHLMEIFSEAYRIRVNYGQWIIEDTQWFTSTQVAWTQAHASMLATERLTRGIFKKKPLIGARVIITDKNNSVIADWELIAPNTWVRHHEPDAMPASRDD